MTSDYITATPLMKRIEQLYPYEFSQGYNLKVYFNSDDVKPGRNRQYTLIHPDTYALEHNNIDEIEFGICDINYIQVSNSTITEPGSYYIYIINKAFLGHDKKWCYSYKIIKTDTNEDIREKSRLPPSFTPMRLIETVQKDYPQTKDCYDIAFHFKLENDNTTFKLLTLIYKTTDKKPHTILKGNIPYAAKFSKDQLKSHIPQSVSKYCALVIKNEKCSFHKPGISKAIEYYPFEIRNVKPDMEKYLDTLA